MILPPVEFWGADNTGMRWPETVLRPNIAALVVPGGKFSSACAYRDDGLWLPILATTIPTPDVSSPVDIADCPFCRIESSRLLMISDVAIALADAYPVAEGHTLVVPRRHVGSIYDLPSDQQQALWELVSQVRRVLIDRFHPDGFNIGFNEGREAGQTVGHAHIHVIPRKKGDVPDPRGSIRWVIADKAAYWTR